MKTIILEALQLLITNDIDIIENRTKEECINHKLAQYIECTLKNSGKLLDHNVDIEYDKYLDNDKKDLNGRKIRPDIIVHKRRSGNANNLIVIEAKKGYPSKHDKYKIIELVDNSKYNYSIGALISYLPDNIYIRALFYEGNNKWDSKKIGKLP